MLYLLWLSGEIVFLSLSTSTYSYVDVLKHHLCGCVKASTSFYVAQNIKGKEVSFFNVHDSTNLCKIVDYISHRYHLGNRI